MAKDFNEIQEMLDAAGVMDEDHSGHDPATCAFASEDPKTKEKINFLMTLRDDLIKSRNSGATSLTPELAQRMKEAVTLMAQDTKDDPVGSKLVDQYRQSSDFKRVEHFAQQSVRGSFNKAFLKGFLTAAFVFILVVGIYLWVR